MDDPREKNRITIYNKLIKLAGEEKLNQYKLTEEEYWFYEKLNHDGILIENKLSELGFMHLLGIEFEKKYFEKDKST